MKALNVDDIKLTVLDYAIGKCNKNDIVKLQIYFIREYLAWLPLRAIAEQTEGRDHTTIISSLWDVRTKPQLRPLIAPIKKILDMKFHEIPDAEKEKFKISL